MRTDEELKAEVMDRLDAIPAVNRANIAVQVDNGVVSVSGQVDSHQTRFHVEHAIRRVPDLRGLAVELKPNRPTLHMPRKTR